MKGRWRTLAYKRRTEKERNAEIYFRNLVYTHFWGFFTNVLSENFELFGYHHFPLQDISDEIEGCGQEGRELVRLLTQTLHVGGE